MNYIVQISVTIAYIFLVYHLWIQSKKFRDEIALLPKKIESIPAHPLIGAGIQEIYDFGGHSLNSISILIFSDTTCPYCSVALEELIQKIHIPFRIPFKVILQATNENDQIDYGNLYDESFEIIKSSDQMIKLFKLRQLPSFVVVDQQGTIVQVASSTDEILKTHFQTLKGGE